MASSFSIGRIPPSQINSRPLREDERQMHLRDVESAPDSAGNVID